MIQTECPYCQQEMEKGIKLTNPWTSNRIEVYYCKACKKMIIDVNKIEF
ncbi:MAG: PF20097 family protein [Tissierellales bacterium]